MWTLEKLECRGSTVQAEETACTQLGVQLMGHLFVCSNENCVLHCYIVISEVYIFS